MSKTYIVGPGREFNYPANDFSAKIIHRAGGRSKLTETDKLQVKIKTVLEGDDCSDMPKDALKLYISRGWVVEKSAEDLMKDTVNAKGTGD